MTTAFNCFEESRIKSRNLPLEWQKQESLDDLDRFLQSNWEQRAAFYEDGEITQSQQFVQILANKDLRTRHYVGTISFKGAQINIFPKVFRESADDTDASELNLQHLMKNLLQWLRYCKRIEYPFINSLYNLDDCDDLRELFISLYLNYVKNAFKVGAFYRYEDRQENLSVIKGQLDFKDYINNKLPAKKSNRFLCSFSEFEFDNQVNRIIKFTCRMLINCTRLARNKEIIRQILIRLNDVSEVRCSPADCDGIRLGKLHGRYSVVLSMSKIFLLNLTTGIETDNYESFCFLFPTSLLFEGFIGGFMRETLGHVAHVRLQASDRTLIDNIHYDGMDYGQAFTMQHDILVEHEDYGVFVLDTKYKKMPRFEGHGNIRQLALDNVSQGDLYQVLEYAAQRELEDAYLLYPMFRFEEEEPCDVILSSKSKSGRTINVHIVRLPFVFEDDVEQTKIYLKKAIERIFCS